MNMESEERLIKIETKIAYLEKYVNELNQVVIEQEGAIKKLVTENEAIKKRLKDGLAENLPETEIPPHY